MTFVLCVYSEKGSAHRCTIAQAESIQQLNVVLMSLLFYPKYIYCGYASIAFSFCFKKLPFCSGNDVTTPSSGLCADCQFGKVIKFIFSDVWKKTTLIAFSPAELLYDCSMMFFVDPLCILRLFRITCITMYEPVFLKLQLYAFNSKQKHFCKFKKKKLLNCVFTDKNMSVKYNCYWPVSLWIG